MLKFDDEVWVMCYPQGQEAHLVEGTIVSGDSDTYIVRYRGFLENNIYRGIFWHGQVFPKGTPFDDYLIRLTKLNGQGLLNGPIANWLWLERNSFCA